MVIIYSNKEVKEISGAYTNPRYFEEEGVNTDATMVYTKDAKIAEAYKKIGVPVKNFPRKTIVKAVVEAVTKSEAE